MECVFNPKNCSVKAGFDVVFIKSGKHEEET